MHKMLEIGQSTGLQRWCQQVASFVRIMQSQQILHLRCQSSDFGSFPLNSQVGGFETVHFSTDLLQSIL